MPAGHVVVLGVDLEHAGPVEDGSLSRRAVPFHPGIAGQVPCRPIWDVFRSASGGAPSAPHLIFVALCVVLCPDWDAEYGKQKAQSQHFVSSSHLHLRKVQVPPGRYSRWRGAAESRTTRGHAVTWRAQASHSQLGAWTMQLTGRSSLPSPPHHRSQPCLTTAHQICFLWRTYS